MKMPTATRQPRFLYLAHPLDQFARGDVTPAWVDRYHDFREAAQMHGFGLYDPGRAWSVGDLPVGDEVLHVNRLALHRCDAMVAFVPAGVPTLGVPVEIDRARAAGKPTVVFTDLLDTSWFLGGDLLWNRRRSVPGVAVGFDPEDVPPAIEWLAAQRVPDSTGHWDRPELMPVQDLGGAQDLPRKAYDSDAGFDLIVSESTVLEPGQFTDVPTGLAIELPGRHWGLIVGRSSTLRNRRIVVAPGVIDNGWRGPIYAGCVHYEDHPIVVEKGERLAQLILMPSVSAVRPGWVSELAPSDRGTNGFGSSGR